MKKMSVINSVFYGKHGEVMRYLFTGGLNVVITWSVYSALVLLGMNPSLSNAISWIVGVSAAFFLNKIFVFNSRTRGKKAVGREAVSFTLGRILTGVINIVGFALLYDLGMNGELFGIEGFFAKIVISVIEIVLNYVISKHLVFINRENSTTE